MRFHSYVVTATARLCSGYQYTLTEKFLGYVLVGLTGGTIESIVMTSPILPSAALGLAGIAQGMFSRLFKAFLGEQFYSALWGGSIWTVGFASFSLTPICLLLVKVGLIAFSLENQPVLIKKVVNLFFIALYASLLVVWQVVSMTLFPERPSLEEYRNLWTYHSGIWLGIAALFMTSLTCSVLDNEFLQRLRVARLARRAVHHAQCYVSRYEKKEVVVDDASKKPKHHRR